MTRLTDKQCNDLHAKADAAGKAAAESHTPTPMVIQQHSNMADDNSPVTKEWIVPQGVCGFAWVNIRPGNSRYANYAKKILGAHKAYYGGTDMWISDYGQSMELKRKYAGAYAKVIREAGFNAHAGSRMD